LGEEIPWVGALTDPRLGCWTTLAAGADGGLEPVGFDEG
jgi:hypothetical protein